MSTLASETPQRRPRRRFSDGFKAGAVRLALDEGRTVGAVARELDLAASTLSPWARQRRAIERTARAG